MKAFQSTSIISLKWDSSCESMNFEWMNVGVKYETNWDNQCNNSILAKRLIGFHETWNYLILIRWQQIM